MKSLSIKKKTEPFNQLNYTLSSTKRELRQEKLLIIGCLKIYLNQFLPWGSFTNNISKLWEARFQTSCILRYILQRTWVWYTHICHLFSQLRKAGTWGTQLLTLSKTISLLIYFSSITSPQPIKNKKYKLQSISMLLINWELKETFFGNLNFGNRKAL